MLRTILCRSQLSRKEQSHGRIAPYFCSLFRPFPRGGTPEATSTFFRGKWGVPIFGKPADNWPENRRMALMAKGFANPFALNLKTRPIQSLPSGVPEPDFLRVLR